MAGHLSTPRMVVDGTGGLAGVSRHDYLPFGEEIASDATWRTVSRGYSQFDGVKMKFTGKERDSETGLDYFIARHHSSPQGRFTSPDPLLSSGTIHEPQTWNRYSYGLNNPLRFNDPSGLNPEDIGTAEDQRRRQREPPPPSPNPQPAPSQNQIPTNVRLEGPQPRAGVNQPTDDGRFQCATLPMLYRSNNIQGSFGGFKVMNRFLLCLLLVSLCAVPNLAQGAYKAKAPDGVAARADERKRLELTTAVIRRRSCFPNTLDLDLRLSFRNAGAEPVILSKKILLGRIMVSRNPEDAAAGKYVTSLRYSLFADEDESGSAFKTPTDLSGFVLLRPGGVYESEENVSFMTHVPAVTAGARSFPDIDFSKGTYFLQIGVGTWPYVADPASLREKWKDKGLLWTQGLNSAPMPFTADNVEPDTKCPPTE